MMLLEVTEVRHGQQDALKSRQYFKIISVRRAHLGSWEPWQPWLSLGAEESWLPLVEIKRK